MIIQLSGCTAPGSARVVCLKQPQEEQGNELHAEHTQERAAESAAHDMIIVTRSAQEHFSGASCGIRTSLQVGSIHASAVASFCLPIGAAGLKSA